MNDSAPNAMTDLPHRAAAHMDVAWRRLTRDRGSVQEDGFLRYVTGEPHPLGNIAIVRDAHDPATTRAAAEPLLAITAPAAVLYLREVDPAVEGALCAMGFSRALTLPAMAVSIDALAPVVLPTNCRWQRATAEDAAEYTSLLASCFELPEGLARRFSPETIGADPAIDAPIQWFAVRDNGRMVATSMIFLADGLAGVYNVTALPEVRGRGIGAFATAQALREASKLGYAVGVLQASAAGYPVYRKLGFEDFGMLPMYMRAPTAGPP
jgi:GNAT superfamily N-acetyltransferase